MEKSEKSNFMLTAHCTALGWCYGRLAALAPEIATPERYDRAIQLPFLGWGELNNMLMKDRGIPVDIQAEIASALAGMEMENLQANSEGQSAFAMGYYRGVAGEPLNPPFDIAAARRRRGWTQRQLADALGVAQTRIAEWEAGRKNPRPQTLNRLKEILA